jgi:hypothetical protein
MIMERKEYQRRNSKKRREQIRKEIFRLLGNKCSNPNCYVLGGCTDPRCLQIDHIKRITSGPGKTTGRISGPERYYKFILRQILLGSNDYQLLCANCNWIKRYENNEK